MKIKKVIAAALSLFMLGGAYSYNAPAVRNYSITADAAGECYTFNSTTGLLTLKGNVVLNEITDFERKEEVKSIKAAAGTVLPKNCDYLFHEYENCISIDLKNADTSNVTIMGNMFKRCYSLTTLDLSSFDTSKVTAMELMFYECSSLNSLDLSNFDTGNVTQMFDMFYGCTALTSLDLRSFDTSSVLYMSRMFFNCEALTSLDLSSFDTSNVTKMSEMFYGCYNLSSLNLSSFDTSSVTQMDFMFGYCETLTSLNLSGFDTSSVENANNMFKDCTSLSTLTLGKYFGDIAEGHKLPNGTGWVNSQGSSEVISGSGEYAAIQNTGKNTYVRAIPMQGDVNLDGFFNVSDLVLMQKWLLAVPDSDLEYWKAGDLCGDGKIDVFDLCLMREQLIASEKATYSVTLKAAGTNTEKVIDIIYEFLGGTTDVDRSMIEFSVNNAPVKIVSDAKKKDAEKLVADLKAAGAVVSAMPN